MRPKVSIVIPVLNAENYLVQCLESVLGQTLRSTEVICVNDCSTDSSPSLLREIARRDSRLRVFDNDRNLGAGASRNRGLHSATGDFIRFVDADDLLPERSTEILYQRAVSTDSDAVRGSLAVFQVGSDQGAQPLAVVPERLKTSFRDEESLWIPWWHTTYLISSHLIRTNNLGFPPLSRGEDPAFLASVLVHARQISLVADIVYLYRKYSKTTGSDGLSFDHVRDGLRHAKLVKALFAENHAQAWDQGYGPFSLNDLRVLLTRCDFDPAQRCILNSEAATIWGRGTDLFADRPGEKPSL